MKAILAVSLLALLLSGYPPLAHAESTTTVDTETGKIELYSSDMGRWSAWSLVEQKRLAAIQAINKPAQVSKDNVQVVLDTEEKIRAWTQYQTTEILGKAVESMAKALNPMSKSLERTPMPRGAVAETFDAIGGVVEKVGSAPAMVAGVVGHFLGKVAEEGIDSAGDKATITGDGNALEINRSQNVSAANGSGVATVTPKVETVQPEIVEVEKPLVVFAPESSK